MNTNSDLQQKVTQELLWDPSLDSSHIGVAVKEGIVTLTGYVTSYFEKKISERIVKRVANVKAVVDELDVKLPGSSERSDLDIAESALLALQLHVLVPRDRVQLIVEDGRVTLDGEVDWHYQRAAAEDALKSMLGVKGILNKIIVKPPVKASDIRAKIQSAIMRNAQLDANHISIETEGGTVILGGHVQSWAEKEQAEAAAWSAPGITKVENNIGIGI
jgi:osmotically-inducible protein OsmY